MSLVLKRLNMRSERRCASCGRFAAGLLALVPTFASRLILCDFCIGQLHSALDHLKVDEREEMA